MQYVCSSKVTSFPLQAWQTAFPPNQAGNHFWERPAVHNGFYQSYTANDFGKKIVRRVCELVSSHDWDWTKVSVSPVTVSITTTDSGAALH